MAIPLYITLAAKAMNPLLVIFWSQFLINPYVFLNKTKKAKGKSWMESEINFFHNISTISSPLHLAAPLGMIDVVEMLITKGASITAIDSRGLSPALACAVNDEVATCLAMILSVFLATPANSEARRSICSISKFFSILLLWYSKWKPFSRFVTA